MADAIGSAYVEIGADTTKFNQQMAGMHNQLASSLGSLSNKSIMLMGAMMGGMQSVVQMAISKIVQMFHQMINVIHESINISTRVETLSVVLEVAGRNAGFTSNEMKAYTQQVAKMGITTQESMQSLTRMAQAQLDLSQAYKLARVSQDAAVVGNINSSEAFGRILHGITTLQPEILRTVGIIVNFEAEYAKAAATLNKSVSSLTQQEKQQAAFNAVIAQGAKIQGIYEASMSTAGKQMQSMKRYVEELKLSIGTVFNEAMFTIVMSIVNAFKDWNKAIDALKNTRVFDEISNILNAGIKIGLELFKYSLEAIWNTAKELYEIFKGLGPVIASLAISVGLLLIPFKALLTIFVDLLKYIQLISVAFIALGDVMLNWADPKAWINFKNVMKDVWKDMVKTGQDIVNQEAVMTSDATKYGEFVAGATAPGKSREQKEIDAQRERDLQIINKEYATELALRKQLDELNKNDKLDAKKKAEEVAKTTKALKEQTELNKKIQDIGKKAGYDVAGELKKTADAFAKGNVQEKVKASAHGIEEIATAYQKKRIEQQQKEDQELRNKKQVETAAVESKIIALNAVYKASQEKAKADFEYQKYLMQQQGKSEIEIANYVKQHKDKMAKDELKHTLEKIKLEQQKETIAGKVASTAAAKIKAAQDIYDAKLYENRKENELEILKIREKSNSALLSYYQVVETSSEKTLELMQKQWENEAKRIEMELDANQKIDKERFVNQKKQEYLMKQQIDLLEYEENKKMSLLAIDEKRGKLSAEYIASEKIESYQRLIDLYEKDLQLKANDANAQLTIRKKIDDATKAIEEQRYALELLRGDFSGGLVQGVTDYYNQMKTSFEYGKQTVNDFAATTKDSISTVFKDLRKGELKDFADYFMDFCDKLADKWTDMLSEMLANWITTGEMMKKAGTGGGEVSGGVFGLLFGSLFGNKGATYSTGGEWGTWGGTFGDYNIAPVAHAGGIVGYDNIPMKAVPASLFDNAPRFHSGLMPDEFPTILKKGEAVFTPGQMQALSNNAPSLVVNVENKTGSPVKATQTDAKFDGKQWIRTVMLELASTDMTVRNKYGVK